ncbi:MAG: 3-isopropylmalate dehydratase small subunit [Myxococcota bacterium]
MPRFARCTSNVVPLLLDHVDTDQIIPARFLKTTTKQGLGDALFADWRSDPSFVLNEPRHAKASFLLVGENFGCGSSREHAAWALAAWGFRVVFAKSFADIFCNNALKNGLLPVALSPDDHSTILRAVTTDPNLEIEVDLEKNTVILGQEKAIHFNVDAFGRHCLLQGLDQLEYILSHEPSIARYEASHG